MIDVTQHRLFALTDEANERRLVALVVAPSDADAFRMETAYIEARGSINNRKLIFMGGDTWCDLQFGGRTRFKQQIKLFFCNVGLHSQRAKDCVSRYEAIGNEVMRASLLRPFLDAK